MNLNLDKLPPTQNMAIRMYNLKQRKGGKYKTRKNRKYKTKRRLYKKYKTNKRKPIKSRRSLRK